MRRVSEGWSGVTVVDLRGRDGRGRGNTEKVDDGVDVDHTTTKPIKTLSFVRLFGVVEVLSKEDLMCL